MGRNLMVKDLMNDLQEGSRVKEVLEEMEKPKEKKELSQLIADAWDKALVGASYIHSPHFNRII